jgi:hypothetical protein
MRAKKPRRAIKLFLTGAAFTSAAIREWQERDNPERMVSCAICAICAPPYDEGVFARPNQPATIVPDEKLQRRDSHRAAGRLPVENVGNPKRIGRG